MMLHIDSFGRYYRFNGDENFTVARYKELVRFGFVQSNYVDTGPISWGDTVNMMKQVLVGSDPVTPSLPALLFTKTSTGTTAGLATASLSYSVSYSAPTVFGFSFYVPSSAPARMYLALAAHPTPFTGTTWSGVSSFFALTETGRIAPTFNGTPQHPIVIERNRRYFIECRFNPANREVRVWVDDELVLQHTLAGTFAATAVAFSAFLGRDSSAYGLSSAIRDFYIVREDGNYPSARLGSAVKVRNVPVVADAGPNTMLAPAGSPSNVSVAYSPIDETYPNVLSATELPATEMYSLAIPDEILAAREVVSVVPKAWVNNTSEFANLSAQIMARLGDGENVGYGEAFAVPSASGYTRILRMLSSTTSPFTGQPWTVEELAALKVGIDVRN